MYKKQKGSALPFLLIIITLIIIIGAAYFYSKSVGTENALVEKPLSTQQYPVANKNLKIYRNNPFGYEISYDDSLQAVYECGLDDQLKNVTTNSLNILVVSKTAAVDSCYDLTGKFPDYIEIRARLSDDNEAVFATLEKNYSDNNSNQDRKYVVSKEIVFSGLKSFESKKVNDSKDNLNPYRTLTTLYEKALINIEQNTGNDLLNKSVESIKFISPVREVTKYTDKDYKYSFSYPVATTRIAEPVKSKGGTSLDFFPLPQPIEFGPMGNITVEQANRSESLETLKTRLATAKNVFYKKTTINGTEFIVMKNYEIGEEVFGDKAYYESYYALANGMLYKITISPMEDDNSNKPLQDIVNTFTISRS